MTSVVSLFRRRARPCDWTQQELAEFYRVQDVLVKSGLRVETDRGLSDEGDPWFIFARADDGEVVVHFARIDGNYLIAGPAYERIAYGRDFSALVRALVSSHPLVTPTADRNSKLVLHPATLLIAVVGTAFFKLGEAKASNEDSPVPRDRAAGLVMNNSISPPSGSGNVSPYTVVALDPLHVMTSLAGLLITTEAEAHLRPSISTGDEAHKSQSNASDGGISFAMNQAADVVPVPSHVEGLTSVLSLIAVLHSLPSAPPVDNPQRFVFEHLGILAEGGAQTADFAKALSLDTESMASGAAAEYKPSANSDALVALSLRPGPHLPEIQVTKFLLATPSGWVEQEVVRIDTLPRALMELIEGGMHIDVADTTAGEPFSLDSDPLVEVDGSSFADSPSLNSFPAGEMIVSNDVRISLAIDYFLDHVNDAQVVITGDQIIICDPRLIQEGGELTNVDSVTLVFDDGTMVSLVGNSAALHEAYMLH